LGIHFSQLKRRMNILRRPKRDSKTNPALITEGNNVFYADTLQEHGDLGEERKGE
jgi:hypothetical protein